MDMNPKNDKIFIIILLNVEEGLLRTLVSQREDILIL